LHRQSLGLSIAAERFGASLFGNFTFPGMAVEHPKQLSANAAERLKASLQTEHGGPDRSHRTIILEEGMKVSRPITINPNDAQFLETRGLQIEEVARILNLPPHKLKHNVGNRPGGNIEQSQIDFMTDTLLPWAARIEQECNRKLISKAQQASHYVETQFNKILRADIGARTAAQKIWFDMGVVDAEQIARQENLPKPKPKAKVEPPTPAPAPAAAPAPADEKVASAARAVAQDAVGRFSRKEAAAVRRASKRGAGEFQAWADGFFRDEVAVLRGFLTPAVRLAMACRGVDGDADQASQRLAERYLGRSKDELLSLPAKDLATRADQIVTRWETSRVFDLVEQILAVRMDEAA
jgi:hypothetical protein